jgi:predicted DNA-binding protein
MLIKNKEKSIAIRLTEENYQKLVNEALRVSRKRKHVTSITEIVTGLIETLK